MSDRMEQQRQAVNDIPEAEFDNIAYISVEAADEVVLDGTFTPAQLRKIITAMESVP